MSPCGVGTCSTHHATLFQGAGTDESVLIEIMATRNNQEIRAINEAYQEGTAQDGRGSTQVLGTDHTAQGPSRAQAVLSLCWVRGLVL